MLCLIFFMALVLLAALPLGTAAGVSRSRCWAAAAVASSVVGLPLAVLLTTQRDPSGYFGVAVFSATAVIGSLGLWAPQVGRVRRAQYGLIVGMALLLMLSVRHNPWSRFDVCFDEHFPGATDRFRAFTAVHCRSGRPIAAPDMAADHAIQAFEDLDGDGVDELLVMESPLACSLSAAWCPAVQTVQAFRIVRNGTVVEIERAGEWPGIRDLYPEDG